MRFKEWLSGFSDKYNQYLDQLMEAGRETASRTYIMADSIGNVEVQVEGERTDNGSFVLRASGHDVNFLEFGAGVLTDVQRPTVQASFDISPGSWSASEDGTGEFAKYGSWHYNKVKYFGFVPAPGMQEACNTMEQQSADILRRVFG